MKVTGLRNSGPRPTLDPLRVRVLMGIILIIVLTVVVSNNMNANTNNDTNTNCINTNTNNDSSNEVVLCQIRASVSKNPPLIHSISGLRVGTSSFIKP